MNEMLSTFLLRYNYDGSEWALSMPARDFEDAKARLARLPFAKIDGELVATVPHFAGPFMAMLALWRNVAKRLLSV